MAASTVTRVIARIGIAISVAAEELETFLARVHATALRAEVVKIAGEIADKFNKAARLQLAADVAKADAQAHADAVAPVVAAKQAEADVHA